MKAGPDISRIAALIGNPASANMLMALIAGLGAHRDRAGAGGGPDAARPSAAISPSSKSRDWSRSRARAAIAISASPIPTSRLALEALMPVAARAGHLRVRTGPRDPELRRARSCYDHLAGDLAVTMFDRLRRAPAADAAGRRPARDGGRTALLRRSAGSTSSALERWPPAAVPAAASTGASAAAIWAAHSAPRSSTAMVARRWAVREAKTRVVRFSPGGEAQKLTGVVLPLGGAWRAAVLCDRCTPAARAFFRWFP